MPFCDSAGKEWPYQSNDILKSEIHTGLSQHYQYTLKGSVDKNVHPIFLVMSGPGTGKSRLLDEFLTLAQESCSEDVGLRTRLEKTYVFKLNFDNGNHILDQPFVASIAIRSRMYHQLHPQELGWVEFKSEHTSKVEPYSVLQTLASITGDTLDNPKVIRKEFHSRTEL